MAGCHSAWDPPSHPEVLKQRLHAGSQVQGWGSKQMTFKAVLRQPSCGDSTRSNRLPGLQSSGENLPG